MDDATAIRLLDLLGEYLEQYGDELRQMTIQDLIDDLQSSLG